VEPARPSPSSQNAAGPRAASWRYVAPFAIFVLLLGLNHAAGTPLRVAYPARILAAALVFWWASRRLVAWQLSRPWASLVAGVGVFVVWIAPDLVWPGYRDLWLFRNPLTGAARSTTPDSLRTDLVFLLFRAGGSALLVPVVEELFWRAWLMRWLISPHFEELSQGTFAPRAFWITAVLFGLEHGPYWDVGLVAGLAYNGWMVRTRNLADCILAHAVTNGCLAGYVLVRGAWQYWL